MWLERTELVSEDEATSIRRAVLGVDFESLVYREIDVRSFALGERLIDVENYANVTATFIDVHGVVHDAIDELTAQDIIGVDGQDYVTEDVQFTTSGPVVVSLTYLVPRNPAADAGDRIVWSKTWQHGASGWRILSSHASRN